MYCRALTSLTIPNSVTSIGYAAFNNCKGLATINSEIVTPFVFGEYAFSGISSTCKLTVPKGKKEAYIAAGWTESVFKGGIVEIVPNISFADANVKAICVANWDTNGDGELDTKEAAAVTDLGTVFKGQKISYFNELQYFTGLTSIASNAFYNSYLASIVIPANVTTIGSYSFGSCTALTSIVLPDNLKTIQTRAFSYCSNLKTLNIPSGVTTIDGYFLENCSSLTSVTIPDGVINMGAGWFSGCTNLTTVNLSTNLTKISDNAFQKCNSLSSVVIPNKVTSIGGSAFSGCSNLKSVTLPDSVKYITGYAFSGCTSLESLTIPNSVTDLDIGTFDGCSSLSSISLPNQLKSLLPRVFEGCTALSSVTIPNSVTRIRENAFLDCSKLASVAIPASVNNIDPRAFEGCSAIENIVVESGNTKYDSRQDCNAIIETSSNTLILGCKNTAIPSSVTTIGGYAFQYCTGLSNFTIPNSVTEINYYAFRYSGLTSIVLPNSLKTIGNSVFIYCDELAEITIPKAVEQIGQSAFKDCGKLRSVISKIEEPFTFGSYAFANIASNCTLTVPYGTKDAYIAKGWTEDVFKGGIVEVDNRNEQSMELASLPTKTYGDAAYTLPAKTTEGLTLTWTSDNINVATISDSILTIMGAGTATITATQEGDGNYKPFSKEFTLTVAKAPLTITANNATKNVGEANPMFTASYEGFVGDDDASVLTAQPTFTSEATTESPVGTYDINVSGAEADNYEMTYVRGTLTVVDETAIYNTLAISDAEGLIGNSTVLPISMSNTKNIKGFQFDLRLPAGVTVATDAYGDFMMPLTNRAHSSHSVSARLLANGDYRVVVSSMSAKNFSGTEGAIMNVTLNVADDVKEGTYEVNLFSIVLNTADNVSITPADVTATLTVSDIEPGDASGDGKVNVTDVGMVIDHILDNTPENFIEAAADLNHDGHVNVTDVGLIIDIILSDPASAKKRGEGNKVDMLAPQ